MKNRKGLISICILFVMVAGLVLGFKLTKKERPTVFLGGQKFDSHYITESVFFTENLFFDSDYMVVQIGDVPILTDYDIYYATKKYDKKEVTIKVIENGKIYERKEYVSEYWQNDEYSVSSRGSGTISFFLKNQPYALLYAHPAYGDGRVAGSIYRAKATGLDYQRYGVNYQAEDEVVGSIVSQDWFGVIAKMDMSYYQDLQEIEIAFKDDVEVGPAYLYTDIGNGTQMYDVNIIYLTRYDLLEEKPYYSDEETKDYFSFDETLKNDEEYFIIEVVDEELADDGIYGAFYGMSGSPIIQNNRIVGFLKGSVDDEFIGARYAQTLYEETLEELK